MTRSDDDELQSTISALIQRIWHAYQVGDATAHNALLADDYAAVFPDGSLHPRRPTEEEIRASPMERFSLRNVQVVPVTSDTAMAHYVAEVEGPLSGKQVRLKWQVGELWVKRGGEWKGRHYQPTALPVV
jgi:ketosteroid isomerase-like protein